MNALQDKVAIVTGSSRGIGKAIALAFAREGARVAVVARTEVEGKIPGTIHETVRVITETGQQAIAIPCDVTKSNQVRAMANRTLEVFGCIDILVNNAGTLFFSSIAETPLQRWDFLMDVNVRGLFLCTKAILPTMMQQRSGSIINLTSVVANSTWPDLTHYGASKAAVERFTLGLAEELKPYRVAVTALDPGLIKSEGALFTHPPDRDWTEWQPPEVVGPPAVWLAAQPAEEVSGKIFRLSEFGRTWGTGAAA